MEVNSISFIGLGKLGLPLAANFAKNGISVVAADKNESLVEQLNSGKVPFFEPGLAEHMSLAKGNIKYQTSQEGFETTDYTVILVNTPNDPVHGPFSNVQVFSAINDICDTLKKHNKESHNFILSSTVMPGTIRNEIIPMIEDSMGWTLNQEFKFAYVPDFVALGTVIRDFETPNLMLIGQSDDEVGRTVEDLYRRTLKNDLQINRMNLLEGELSKIAFNTFIISKLSYVNFLGNVCDAFGGANVDTITSTIGMDKRISANPPLFFKAGLSFGGACFPRDVWAFQEMCRKLELDPKHILAAEQINDEQDNRMIELIKSTGKKKIGFFGVAFKPKTPITMYSVAEKITERMLVSGFEIHCHDFVGEALDIFRDTFDSTVSYYTDMQECLDSCEVAVIMTPCQEYKELGNIRDNQIVIDGWRLIEDDFDGLIQPGNLKCEYENIEN